MIYLHPLGVTCIMSLMAGTFCYWLIPKTSQSFIQAGLKGLDMSKKEKVIISESMGAICGLIYLLSLFFLLPFAFITWLQPESFSLTTFTLHKFSSFLSALLSIQSMLFLGFADDVLNIKWRYKIFLPAFASIPLLFVYAIESNVTWVVVPIFFRSWLGKIINL
ncbi:UDP-N-acetylglucosamine--dolichyl-phosphate N-acetylglucosaminephosphotransferase, partial [Coelomomyces lativittatus]